MARIPGVFPLLLLVLLSAGGCSHAATELTSSAVEFALRVERLLATDQVTELASDIDSYWLDYRQTYSLNARVADKPLAIAEAYLREYQPGPLPRVFQTTYVYDRNGKQLAELFDEGYRTWVSLDQISPSLVEAIIATEDASFYQNPGIDVRRVAGAFLQNAEAGEVVSGASTITMQLARYLFFQPSRRFEQSMERKTLEALLAQDLSILYSKDEILEMYLNLVHFGQQVYGAEAASQIYFGKRAADLTLAEATLLAGVPQKPGEYDLSGNLDLVKSRQRVVLDLMTRHGYLSAGDADRTFSQPIQILPKSRPLESLAPHFVQYVAEQMNHRTDGVDVRRSGMRIFTTLDWRMQELAQRTVSEQVAQLQDRYGLSNAALVALKRGTADILAMVGSADFYNKEIAGQVNVAVRARQPGSAIKPVLYATAMDDLIISPATVIWDLATEYEISDQETYRPRNYDDEFHGPVTVRSALANSYNVPAVKLLDAIGVERMLERARTLGIESLDRDEEWYGLSLTLGGGEVTLLDLTSAFHTLANEGGYVSPRSVLYTAEGDEIRESAAMGDVESVQAISVQTAFLITDILSDNDARLPAFGSNSPLQLSRPAAAKTGTTTDFRDNWTEGYTRYLVAGVWAGNSDGRPMRNVSGVTGAAPIWHAFMEGVLADPELIAVLGAPEDPDAWEFERPDGIDEVGIDCPAGLVCREREYFASEWMELTETTGPMVYSVMDGAVSTVYVDRGRGSQPLGACSQVGDVVRRLLRLPYGIGRSGQTFDGEPSAESVVPESVGELSEERVRDLMTALLWSQDASTPVYLGPCDQVEAVVSALYSDTVQSIAVGEFTDLVAGVDDSGGGVMLSAPIPPDAIPSSRYNLVGVAHDRYCGGTFVMGQVANAQGQPIGGIRVLYQDRLGNEVETLTSRSAATYGSYKFPVLADSGHDIYISLLDGAGEPLSDRAVVPHKQGGVTDLPCHFAIWRGVD